MWVTYQPHETVLEIVYKIKVQSKLFNGPYKLRIPSRVIRIRAFRSWSSWALGKRRGA